MKTLFNKIWLDNKMIPEIRDKFLSITTDFINNLKVEPTVTDIILTGSASGYDYTESSDIDLHIVVDVKENKLLLEYYTIKAKLWNLNHNITIDNHEIELYVQASNAEHFSENIYSVQNDKWIKEPLSYKAEIDIRSIETDLQHYIKIIDKLLELETVTTGSKLKTLYDKASTLKDYIKTKRKTALKTNGIYSKDNLVFKGLRKLGYIEKLIGLINLIYDKIYIEENKNI